MDRLLCLVTGWFLLCSLGVVASNLSRGIECYLKGSRGQFFGNLSRKLVVHTPCIESIDRCPSDIPENGPQYQSL